MAAEEQLHSTVPAERQGAATTLGDLRCIDSYGPLLQALEREGGPGNGDRAVKDVILKSLEKIGSEHSADPISDSGYEPLNRFIMAHLADAGLVKSGLKALKWTDTVEKTSTDASTIADAAEAAGYPDSASAASGFYIDIISR